MQEEPFVSVRLDQVKAQVLARGAIVNAAEEVKEADLEENLSFASEAFASEIKLKTLCWQCKQYQVPQEYDIRVPSKHR